MLRLRVFAGPNGSGKSTVIHKVKDIPVDFGTYVNADDIARGLSPKRKFIFNNYGVVASKEHFIETAQLSGLLNERFTERMFLNSFEIKSNSIVLTTESPKHKTLLAQVVADYLRKSLLKSNKKFSFETVFSHQSKLDIMREAQSNGYKVYLYFISTESPEINKYRVHVRTTQGGHNVPENLIEKRYYRSLDLMYDAAQLAYQAYFFDNSVDGQNSRLFAHFKLDKEGKKVWDSFNAKNIPNWFITYYLNKDK